MALFISFEGGEGSGKSTQAARLCRAIAESGIATLFIHEPGTTRLGVHIRQLIKGRPWGRDTISPIAELFLFSASRAELVKKTLEPEMEKSRLVIVADRYVDSTVAYQGYGRKIPLELISAINKLACQDIMPDLTFLMDCDPADGLKRVEAQTHLFDTAYAVRLDKEGSRRFEEEPLDFHNRIRNGYLQLTKDEPERWIILDAMETEEAIFERVWERVQNMEKFKIMPRQMSFPSSALRPIGSEVASEGSSLRLV